MSRALCQKLFYRSYNHLLYGITGEKQRLFFLATAQPRIDHLTNLIRLESQFLARPSEPSDVYWFYLTKAENTMEVSEAIQKRVTIRRWKQKPMEKGKIIRVLEAGRRAPSWGNVQPWRYVMVQDRAKIEELAKSSAGQPHIGTAPVVIVCCGVMDAFSWKMHRESLKQLIEAVLMDCPDEDPKPRLRKPLAEIYFGKN